MLEGFAVEGFRPDVLSMYQVPAPRDDYCPDPAATADVLKSAVVPGMIIQKP